MARPVPTRADARRSYEAIVRAATTEVAARGEQASLEEIARVAGVGSATLHRHFPSRWDLMQAVFGSQIVALCDRATELADAEAPGAALRAWLDELTRHVVTTRGLAASLELADGVVAHPDDSCEAMLLHAGDGLLAAAKASGDFREDVSAADVLGLVGAITTAAGTGPAAATTAERLVRLALDGVAPRDPA